jgi:hypothetical protein
LQVERPTQAPPKNGDEILENSNIEKNYLGKVIIID